MPGRWVHHIDGQCQLKLEGHLLVSLKVERNTADYLKGLFRQSRLQEQYRQVLGFMINTVIVYIPVQQWTGVN